MVSGRLPMASPHNLLIGTLGSASGREIVVDQPPMWRLPSHTELNKQEHSNAINRVHSHWASVFFNTDDCFLFRLPTRARTLVNLKLGIPETAHLMIITINSGLGSGLVARTLIHVGGGRARAFTCWPTVRLKSISSSTRSPGLPCT